QVLVQEIYQHTNNVNGFDNISNIGIFKLDSDEKKSIIVLNFSGEASCTGAFNKLKSLNYNPKYTNPPVTVGKIFPIPYTKSVDDIIAHFHTYAPKTTTLQLTPILQDL